MTSVVAVLLILVLFALMTYAGVRDGAFFSLYALMRNAFAFFCAMSFCEPMARLLGKLIGHRYPAPDYWIAISFAAILGAVFATCRHLKMKYTAPNVPCPQVVDRVTGPAIGIINAVVVTGSLLILWSLLPFAKYIPGNLGHIHFKTGALDTGQAMLRFYSFASERMGGGGFLLDDEPLVEDHNENARGDPGDSYDDVNENGRWDRGWLWRYRNHAMIDPSHLRPLPGVLESRTRR
ncbi:MAG: CvpA family protein [Planctomycetota bacterium]|jgi:hypothetical protein